MKPLYPHAQLLQIKPKDKLSNLLNELEHGFQGFYGVGRLLQQAQNLLDDEKNVQIEEINNCLADMNDFKIKNLPIKEKLSQINYVLQCADSVDFYFKPNQSQTLNNELNIQKNQLEKIKTQEFDFSLLDNIFEDIDKSIVNQVEQLFKKIKEMYSRKELNPSYETYLQDQISLLTDGGDEKTKAALLYQKLVYLMNFLNRFEDSYKRFNELEDQLESNRNTYLELCKELINSETILNQKEKIKQQIAILDKDFSDFDPSLNYLEELNLGLIQLAATINELSVVNQAELRNQREQYIQLISPLINSKINLALHAKKLKANFFWAKLGKKKSDIIDNIQKKMDALLEFPDNNGPASSNKESINALQQSIGEAKAILSEYRGLSFFRNVARLWGGGKVTSQLLVETLEKQVEELQSNINNSRLPPSL